MNTAPPTSSSTTPATGRTTSTRALVLGGGGSAGNAWLIGVIAGLFENGVDVTEADLIIGTSAGSTAAAQITGASPSALFADVLAAHAAISAARTGATRRGDAPAQGGATMSHLERTAGIIAAAEDAADMRRRMGADAIGLARAADDGSGPARWRSTVAARLPVQDWPLQTIGITAVDALTGEPVVFDRESGVGMADAVAASCAGGPAHRIGDRWFIDGGYRSVENADLAAGFERVLVLAPLGGRTRMPLEWGMYLAPQIDRLRANGSSVESILPDSVSLAAFGDNMMDLATRAPAARAGFAQGTALADQLSGFWR